MILKGSQRGNGQNLAVHLMRVDDNEHVSLHELRGFSSETLAGAFKEAEAISRGTKCRQYLFSLSLSPPADARVPVSTFEGAIGQVEKRLGLEGQPRAIVFHEKEGRRHAHCVWSRIDPETMTARQMSFFKTKLQNLSRELYLEHGWKLPGGLETPSERDPTNFSLAEWQQAKRQGIDPRWLKQMVQTCWTRADGMAAFASALGERGFALARGDRRDLVVLDWNGEVYALPRMLGLKTRDVRERLGRCETLPGVAQAQQDLGQRMTPAIRRHVQQARDQFRERADRLAKYRAEMTELHRQARTALEDRQTREWDEETRIRTARLPKGLRGLWHRLTGSYRKIRAFNEAEASATQKRQARQRDELIEEQHSQRAVLQSRIKDLRRDQAEQLVALRGDLGRYLGLTRERGPSSPARNISPGLKLER